MRPWLSIFHEGRLISSLFQLSHIVFLSAYLKTQYCNILRVGDTEPILYKLVKLCAAVLDPSGANPLFCNILALRLICITEILSPTCFSALFTALPYAGSFKGDYIKLFISRVQWHLCADGICLQADSAAVKSPQTEERFPPQVSQVPFTALPRMWRDLN